MLYFFFFLFNTIKFFNFIEINFFNFFFKLNILKIYNICNILFILLLNNFKALQLKMLNLIININTITLKIKKNNFIITNYSFAKLHFLCIFIVVSIFLYFYTKNTKYLVILLNNNNILILCIASLISGSYWSLNNTLWGYFWLNDIIEWFVLVLCIFSSFNLHKIYYFKKYKYNFYSVFLILLIFILIKNNFFKTKHKFLIKNYQNILFFKNSIYVENPAILIVKFTSVNLLLRNKIVNSLYVKYILTDKSLSKSKLILNFFLLFGLYLCIKILYNFILLNIYLLLNISPYFKNLKIFNLHLIIVIASILWCLKSYMYLKLITPYYFYNTHYNFINYVNNLYSYINNLLFNNLYRKIYKFNNINCKFNKTITKMYIIKFYNEYLYLFILFLISIKI